MIAPVDTDDPDRLFLLVVLRVGEGAGVDGLSAIRRGLGGFCRLQFQVSSDGEQLRAIRVRCRGGQAPRIRKQGDGVQYRKAKDSNPVVHPFLTSSAFPPAIWPTACPRKRMFPVCRTTRFLKFPSSSYSSRPAHRPTGPCPGWSSTFSP